MQLRFLKMLRVNENKFQTLRVSVPRQIRQNIWKNKKSKALKLSMENEVDIIFGVDPSSGLTMVKEVISTDVSSAFLIGQNPCREGLRLVGSAMAHGHH